MEKLTSYAVDIADMIMEVLLEIDAQVQHLIEAQVAYSMFAANELAQAKEECALVETMAMMEAYADNRIDGKNAEQRTMQMTAYLSGHPDCMVARAELRNAEREAAGLQAAKEAAELSYKAATYRLHGLRSVADLQARMMEGTNGNVA